MNATLPRRLDLLTAPVKIDLPQLVVCTELDEPTGGYHIEVIWRGLLPPSIQQGETGGGGLAPEPEPTSGHDEHVTLLVATAFLASFGLSLKSGRLLITSEEFSGRLAVRSTLLGNLMLPPPAREGSREMTGSKIQPDIATALTAVAGLTANDKSPNSGTITQDEVNKAVVSASLCALFRTLDNHRCLRSLISDVINSTFSYEIKFSAGVRSAAFISRYSRAKRDDKSVASNCFVAFI